MSYQQQTLDHVIRWVLTNFSLSMLVLAIIFILLHKLVRRNLVESEIVYRWIAFFSVGISSIYAYIMHAYFPVMTARDIGWTTSPFQFEVAIANLAIGIIGILSFNASYGFRLATTIAAVVWFWGDAINHIYEMLRVYNFTPGNAGSWLITDILVPVILLFTIRKLRKVDFIQPAL